MSQISCHQCGKTIEADSHFCLYCGAPQPASAGVRPAAAPPPPLPRLRPEFLVVGGIAILVILAVCSVGAAFWLTQASPEGASPTATPESLFTTPIEATPTEEVTPVSYGSMALASVDLSRLGRIAQEFSDPNTRRAADPQVSITDILTSPEDYAGQTVTVTGQLAQRILVYNIAPRDWPRAYYLDVKVGDTDVPVVYRGYVGNALPGDAIQVIGAFSAGGLGINADQVSPVETAPKPALPMGITIPLLLATVVNLFWAVLCTGVFIWRSRRFWPRLRRPRGLGGALPAIALALLLMSVLLTSCTIDIVTTVYPDGSGTVGTTFSETPDNVNFLRQMPGMGDYFQTFRDDLRRRGVLVDDSVYQNLEEIHFQSVFGSLNDIAQTELASTSERSWVSAQAVSEAAEHVYRYSALIDTTALFEQAPGIDPNVAAEAGTQLQQTKITYSVTLPGQIVYQNATRMIGNQLIWDIRMNEQNQIRAEARLPEPPPPDYSPFFWLAEGVVFVFFALLLLIGLVAFRTRKA